MKEEKIFSFVHYLASNPILSLICVLFFIGDIVLTTCIIYDRIHRREVMEFRNSYNELWKSRDRLSVLLEEIRDNYNRESQKLNRTEEMYKKLEKRTRDAQAALDSKLSSLTADLHTCQNVNLDFISKISRKDSEITTLKDRLHVYEESSRLRQEDVSYSYNARDGSAPMAKYLGEEGWCLELELQQ